VEGESCYFLSVNRNKKSVAVDIKTKQGQDLIRELSLQCDVLIENYIPGKLSEMNLGYEQLREIAPHLIYCSITGYGQTGPYASRAGYDVICSGVGGLMDITGPADGEPAKVGVAMTDMMTGLYAGNSIMAALISRSRTGQGQHIDCNLLSSQVAVISYLGANYLNAGWIHKRHGTAHVSIVPYQAFRTSDGYIIIGAGNNKLFKIACRILDLEHLVEDPKYVNNSDRVNNREELLAIIKQRVQEKTTDEWLRAFEGSGIPYGPINNMQQVFQNPQVIHNDLIQIIDHPKCGEIKVPGPAVRFSGTPTQLTHPPPGLGQHTQEVLQNMLGYDEEKIQELAAKGVVQLGS